MNARKGGTASSDAGAAGQAGGHVNARKGGTASSDAGAAGQAGGHVNACGGCHRSQSSCFCQGPGQHPAMEA